MCRADAPAGVAAAPGASQWPFRRRVTSGANALPGPCLCAQSRDPAGPQRAAAQRPDGSPRRQPHLDGVVRLVPLRPARFRARRAT